MSDLEELRKAIIKFTQERDRDQFHNRVLWHQNIKTCFLYI